MQASLGLVVFDVGIRHVHFHVGHMHGLGFVCRQGYCRSLRYALDASNASSFARVMFCLDKHHFTCCDLAVALGCRFDPHNRPDHSQSCGHCRPSDVRIASAQAQSLGAPTAVSTPYVGMMVFVIPPQLWVGWSVGPRDTVDRSFSVPGLTWLLCVACLLALEVSCQVYYFAISVDLVLRLSWTVTLLPSSINPYWGPTAGFIAESGYARYC